ncbi:MAG: alpha/beta hydrolase [Desulfomonilaceae bacterium]
MSVASSDIVIPCGQIRLEGTLEFPTGLQGRVPAAVICHPHPLYGGTMHNNVAGALSKAFLDRGVAALRFNFRGVGRSGGTHGNGVDEMKDVRAALDYLETAPAVDPQKLIVAGYSFGCWVGLRAVHDDRRPARLIGVSPPLDMYDFSFLKQETRPKLFLVGDRDFVCSVSSFRRFMEELHPPKMASILKGADHFHSGGEQEIVSQVHAFLDNYPFQKTV